MANSINNISKYKKEHTLHNARSQNIQRQHIPQEYIDFAKGMEQQFAELMIEQMKKTGGLKTEETAGNFYQSLMTREEAKRLMASGLGISDLILKQLIQKSTRR